MCTFPSSRCTAAGRTRCSLLLLLPLPSSRCRMRWPAATHHGGFLAAAAGAVNAHQDVQTRGAASLQLVSTQLPSFMQCLINLPETGLQEEHSNMLALLIV